MVLFSHIVQSVSLCVHTKRTARRVPDQGHEFVLFQLRLWLLLAYCRLDERPYHIYLHQFQRLPTEPRPTDMNTPRTKRQLLPRIMDEHTKQQQQLQQRAVPTLTSDSSSGDYLPSPAIQQPGATAAGGGATAGAATGGGAAAGTAHVKRGLRRFDSEVDTLEKIEEEQQATEGASGSGFGCGCHKTSTAVHCTGLIVNIPMHVIRSNFNACMVYYRFEPVQ